MAHGTIQNLRRTQAPRRDAFNLTEIRQAPGKNNLRINTTIPSEFGDRLCLSCNIFGAVFGSLNCKIRKFLKRVLVETIFEELICGFSRHSSHS